MELQCICDKLGKAQLYYERLAERNESTKKERLGRISETALILRHFLEPEGDQARYSLDAVAGQLDKSLSVVGEYTRAIMAFTHLKQKKVCRTEFYTIYGDKPALSSSFYQ